MTQLARACCLAVTISIMLAPAPAQAFNSMFPLGSSYFDNPGLYPHKYMTQAVLSDLGFQCDAIPIVVDANHNTDLDLVTQAQLDRHFCRADNETSAQAFLNGLDRLSTTRDLAIARAAAGQYEFALEAIGTSLHTLQDYFSHTNHIEDLTSLERGQILEALIWTSTPQPGLDLSNLRVAGYTFTGIPFGVGNWLDGCPLGDPYPHGSLCALSAQVCSGFNKDCFTRPGFPSAYNTAATVTGLWMRALRTDIIATSGVATWDALRLFKRPCASEAADCACSDEGEDDDDDDTDIDVVVSYDPNDIIGPEGAGAPRYVHAPDAMDYEVLFENIGTGDAQEVVVSNLLDRNRFDFTTFSLGPISFGDRVIAPPPGLADYTTDVDLRPDRQVVVRIHGRLDPLTGLASWSFISMDPLTGEPPELDGFLPPNTPAPAGEGSVQYSIRSLEGLSTGEEVRNQATILFDANEAIETPVWVNTLDQVPPQSMVLELPPVLPDSTFLVSWAGSDDGSGIRDFSIYISEDAGPYHVWRANTSALSDSFPGGDGHTYAFYSVARDSAGNVEAPPTGPDAVTGVTPALVSLVSASAEPGIVRLSWYCGDPALVAATVYRREREGAWEIVGSSRRDGTGQFSFEDLSVTAEARYGYRLGLNGSGRDFFGPEVFVDVPSGITFRLEGTRPNPGGGPISIAFSLVSREAADLSLIDVAGRVVWSQRVGSLGPGNHVIALHAAAVPPGVYIVRLTQSGRALTSRAVLMR